MSAEVSRKRPWAVSVLAIAQLAYVGVGFLVLTGEDGPIARAETALGVVMTSVLVGVAIGLWRGSRWAYVIELGVLGGFAVGLSVIAVLARNGNIASVGAGLLGVAFYLTLAGSVRRYYERKGDTRPAGEA